MLIDPDAFEACFSAWAQSFAEAFDREVVAIDGKTLRRSFGRAQGPLHLVSASEQGLALGQRMASRTRSPRSRGCSRRCP